MSIECQCTGPGYCPLYERTVNKKEYELCSCTCDDPAFCDENACEKRRYRWLNETRKVKGLEPLAVPNSIREARPLSWSITEFGPGRELGQLLERLGLKMKPGCGCGGFAQKMNRWGVEGCKRNRELILAKLRTSQAELKWSETIKAAFLATTTGMAFKFNPLDPAPGLLDEAIRLAIINTPKTNLQWIKTSDLVRDTWELLRILPPDVAGVCGIPRSGMLPASIIATALHIPLWSVDKKTGEIRSLANGARAKTMNREGRLLILDDTVHSGTIMRHLRKELKAHNCLYASVYVRPESAGIVDLYARMLPSPHLLEWNLFNSTQILGGATVHPLLEGGIATDFDGVLCHDPPVPDADDGEGLQTYLAWMKNAKPFHLPRRSPVPLVVTFRLEKWRSITVEWCLRWGIRIGVLKMHHASTASERNRNFDVATHKGQAYKDSPHSLFVESNEAQAQVIFEVAKKPVLHLATGRILQ